ncbi:MAG: DUF1566 domain-containing protein [Bryobacterales bacterium]|nr:DUF1566 domain-containing protein [Bryobacterales bacterium]
MKLAGVFLLASALTAEVAVTLRALPDTGQTRHFSPGDDADYSIRPPVLTRNEDGTVLDEVTGLQWQQSDGGEMTLDRAGEYCPALDLGGHRDWRLPTNRELFSIMNHNNPPPAIDNTAFTRSAAEYWWSSDLLFGDPSRAWVVNAGGGSGPHPRVETVSAGGEKKIHVRCVRQTWSGEVDTIFTTNADGTVTDNRTGLIWQEVEAEDAMTWQEALDAAHNFDLGGFTDWRLPNIKELQSLHDETAVRPSISPMFFPTARAATYWSSTTQISREADRAWSMDLTLGIVSYHPKMNRQRVRLVRGGHDE